jgi:hypothetical protein
MRNSPELLAKAQEYAEFRFGGDVRVERLLDGGDQLGLTLTNTNVLTCGIELYAPGSTATIFAGPIRYETLEEGVLPVLWVLDLLMTYTVYELRSLVGQRGVVQSAPLSTWQPLWVKHHWPAWSGEARSRETAAEAFGHPETFGPPQIRTFQASLFYVP